MSKIYETLEVIKALFNNPKLKFKDLEYIDDGFYDFITVERDVICWGGNKEYPLNIVVKDKGKWELVQEPVDIKTAWEANKNGKAIKHVFDDDVIVPGYMSKEKLYLRCFNADISIYRLLNGTWYIED